MADRLNYVEDGYLVPDYVGRGIMFATGTSSVMFTRSPLRHSRGRRRVQARVQSSGAERIGQPSFGKNDIIELTWQSMSTADVATINSWWFSCRGMGRSFNYTDLTGISYSVRFATPARPQIREKAYGSYECRISLRIL